MPSGLSGRKRSGYQWSVEVSVYVAAEARGRVAGRRLYTALFDLLRRQGYVTAFAGIALPNEASVGLHEAMGFRPIGYDLASAVDLPEADSVVGRARPAPKGRQNRAWGVSPR